LDAKTKGPLVDQNSQTLVDGIFCCGNALHVNDLVDYVSESGEAAGLAAARRVQQTPDQRPFAEIAAGETLLYIVPQRLDVNDLTAPVIVYFRSRDEMGRARLSVTLDGREIFSKKYPRLRPPEMERLEFDFTAVSKINGNIKPGSVVNFSLSEAE
jgi:hypothetical protein